MVLRTASASTARTRFDAEFSFWNDEGGFGPGANNMDWNSWPSTGHRTGNPSWEGDYKLSQGTATDTTVRIVWTSPSIRYYIMNGVVDVGSAPTNLAIPGVTYAPSNPATAIPQTPICFGFNHWIYNHVPASTWNGGAEQDVTITDFKFVPQGSQTYVISASAGSGGSLSPTGNVTVNPGANQTFTVTPNTGYAISAVTVDGANKGEIGSYTFSNVQAAHTISAAFTASGGGGGGSNLAPSGTGYLWSKNTSGTANTNKIASAAVNDGNLTASQIINANGEGGAAIWEAAGVTWALSSRSLPSSSSTAPSTRTGTAFSKATSSCNSAPTARRGPIPAWAVTPAYPNTSAASGQTYTFSGATKTGVLGARVTGQTGTSSWSAAVDEMQVFGPSQGPYTITASAGTGGSISPTGAVSVNAGASQAFTITANSGYSVSSVTVDGASQGAIGSYTFTNVQATHTITAAFTASAGDTNIAPIGTGYLWSKNASSTANTNKVASTAVNDNNTTATVIINVNGEGGAAIWEAAGVTWPTAKTLSSAKFINGAIDAYGNGFFEAGVKLQFTTDGTTWTDSGWTVSPAYPNSAAAGGQTYTFTGAAKSGVVGARITGQTGANSWSGAVIEVQLIGH